MHDIYLRAHCGLCCRGAELMQGFLTNGIIAGLLLTFGLFTLFTLMSDMAKGYNVTLGDEEQQVLAQSSIKSAEIQRLAYSAQQSQQNATIDESVTDFAQLQGLAGSESQKKNGFEIFLFSMQQLQGYFPFDSSVTALILSIIATLTGASLIYLIIGRWV